MIKFFLILFLILKCHSTKKTNKMILRNSMEDFSKLHIKATDYIKGNRANPDILHEIIISIPQKNQETLVKLLHEVSDHTSPKYGNYLSFDEIGELVSNPQSTAAVQNWLESNDVSVVSVTDHGEYITAVATIGVWEKLFDAKFHEFQHSDSSTFHSESDSGKSNIIRPKQNILYRALSYSLPENMNNHVESIFRLTSVPPIVFNSPVMAPLDENALKGYLKNISAFVDISNPDQTASISIPIDPDLLESKVKRQLRYTKAPVTSKITPSEPEIPLSLSSTSENNSTSTDSVQIIPLDDSMDSIKFGTAVFPEILKVMYNITGNGDNVGSQAIYETVGNTFLPSDLPMFQNYFGVQNVNVSNYYGDPPDSTVCQTPSFGR